MPSNPSRDLEFSRQAEEDIRGILQYTAEEWGDRVRREYARRLDGTLLHLLDDPMLGRSCDELAPGLRSHPSGEHVIFITE